MHDLFSNYIVYVSRGNDKINSSLDNLLKTTPYYKGMLKAKEQYEPLLEQLGILSRLMPHQQTMIYLYLGNPELINEYPKYRKVTCVKNIKDDFSYLRSNSIMHGLIESINSDIFYTHLNEEDQRDSQFIKEDYNA